MVIIMSKKSITYKIISICANMIKEGNQKIIKLSLAMKRRESFIELWKQSNEFNWPFEYS